MKMKIYPLALTANGSQTLLAVGSFVRLRQMTGSVSISVDDLAAAGPLTSGQGFRLPSEFKRVTITDTSGAANVGSIIVADADFVDQTLLGTVEVIDSAVNRTLAGSGFAVACLAAAGGAGTFSTIQLWNPAGSGKRVRVDQLMTTPGVAAIVRAQITQVQCTNASFQPAGANKLAGGANSSALGRVDNTATDYLVTGKDMFYIDAAANLPNVINFRYPVVLGAGYGLTLRPASQNVALDGWFEFVEESA